MSCILIIFKIISLKEDSLKARSVKVGELITCVKTTQFNELLYLKNNPLKNDCQKI